MRQLVQQTGKGYNGAWDCSELDKGVKFRLCVEHGGDALVLDLLEKLGCVLQHVATAKANSGITTKYVFAT